MLLKYLCVRTGVLYLSELRYTDLWQDVLLVMCQDKEICQSFSIYDWQETLLYLKGEELVSDNYEEYIKRLLTSGYQQLGTAM